MACEVLAFPSTRFTPADVTMFNELAERNLTNLMWDRVERVQDRHGDRMLVYIPRIAHPVFAFARCVKGYFLFYNDVDNWRVLHAGETAGEALLIALLNHRAAEPLTDDEMRQVREQRDAFIAEQGD